jgi:hypothetical protein
MRKVLRTSMSQHRHEANFGPLQDVVVSADRTFIGSVTEAKTITLKGTLFYQACDIVK